MAKVFSGIEGIDNPQTIAFGRSDKTRDYRIDFDKLDKDLDKYVEDIKTYAKLNGSGKYAGEEIGFPVGDGQARYVVLSTKPVQLIHLYVHDGWQFQYAHRVTAKDIADEVERGKRLAEIFAR